MSDTFYIKFPGAKNYLEIEEADDIIGLSRVLQLGYGVKVDRDKCDLVCENNDVREIIFGMLCNDSMCNNDDNEPTLRISLPGTDRWFDATGTDIMSARILLGNGFGVVITPENTQVACPDNEEIQKLIDDYLPLVEPENMKNFLYGVWSIYYDLVALNEPVKNRLSQIKCWLKK